MERAALAFAADEADAAARIAAWERWLEHDPNDTPEARAEARARELMEAV
ncbi:MAG TPA: hypothetical protein VFH56_02110 [Acidimicrobiales bacterium]|nr:hypothetical protein [Acidimicrobiales bacterium]